MFAKYFLFLFLFSCLVRALPAEPLPPNEIKALLDRIRQKHGSAPSVQKDFQEEKTLRMMNKPVVTSGKVWFQAPNKFRREVRGNSPSTAVSDGKTLWIYYPKFQSAERYTLGKRSPLDAGIAALTAALNLQGVEQTYNITGSREGDHYQLELVPRPASLKRLFQRFVIRFDDAFQVERTEMVQPNGDRIATTYSNESRGTIDPGLFNFTPPAGTNVTTPLGQ